MCISPQLSVILDLFSILSSLSMSVMSLALATTTYANWVPSANRSLCMLSRFWFMLWSVPELIMAMRSKYVFLQLMHLSTLKMCSQCCCPSPRGIPKFSHRSSFIRHHFSDFLFVNASNSRSAPSWETVLLALLHNTSRLTVSQFLLYLVVPPFGLRLWATCLFPGHERLWLSLEVLLSWTHPTGTSYLSPLQTFSQYHLISSTSSWKPHYLSVKTLARVGAPLIQVALYFCFSFDHDYEKGHFKSFQLIINTLLWYNCWHFLVWKALSKYDTAWHI